MPNIKSAKKKLRKDVKRTKQNDKHKILIKKLFKQLQKKSGKEAIEFLKKVVSSIDKAAKRNIIHKNKAARFKSKANRITLKNK